MHLRQVQLPGRLGHAVRARQEHAVGRDAHGGAGLVLAEDERARDGVVRDVARRRDGVRAEPFPLADQRPRVAVAQTDGEGEVDVRGEG